MSGSNDENELILLSVLEAVYDAVYSLMKGQVEKRTMLDNLELILLTIDEAVSYRRCLLESDCYLNDLFIYSWITVI